MEGFGIARRTSLGRFALRSRMLLELMATDEQDLTNKLEQFRSRDAPPRPFDPKNNRRILPKSPLKVQCEGRMSPLTDGQEADLLTPSNEKPISVVFGCAAAGIGLVEAALTTTRRARSGQVEVQVKSFLSKKEFLDHANHLSGGHYIKALVLTSGSALDTGVGSRGRARKASARRGPTYRFRRWSEASLFLGGPTHLCASMTYPTFVGSGSAPGPAPS